MPNRVFSHSRADLRFHSAEISSRNVYEGVPEPSGVVARNAVSLLRAPLARHFPRPAARLFTEAGHRVEGALLPVAPFALQIADVQLVAEALHDLLGEQVIYQGCLDAAVVVHQLEQLKVRLFFCSSPPPLPLPPSFSGSANTRFSGEG